MSQEFRLTVQQLQFFNTFGYLSFPGLLADDSQAIIEAFEAVWTAHGGGHHGKPHDGKARACIVPFIDQNEYLSSLLDNPCILSIGTALLGNDFNYTGSDGNYYVGDTAWHSDGGYPKDAPMHLKIAFYLDPLTPDTGGLRVIAGSHCFGDDYGSALEAHVRQSHEKWGLTGRDVPAVAFTTQPGDIVCFNQNIKHAAFGGGTRRRMFTMNLCQRYPENCLEDLREFIGGAARFWIERSYGDKMVRTAGSQRMRHLEQIMQNDGHLAALSRQVRAKMTEPSRG